jgi:hypothetical protein
MNVPLRILGQLALCALLTAFGPCAGRQEPPNVSVNEPAPAAPKPPAQPPLVNPATPKEGQILMPQNPSATAFQLIDAIAALPDLNKAALEGVSRVALAHSPTAGQTDLYYEAMLPSGPFQRIELRLSNPSQAKFALVFLAARPGVPLSGSTFRSAGRIGPTMTVSINPNVPPEGTTTYDDRRKDQTVSYEFTTDSDILRTVKFERRPAG